MAQLSQRSNSLFPYQLEEVLSASPVAGTEDHQELLLAVKRGDKRERFAVTVKPAADGHVSLLKWAQRSSSSGSSDVTKEAGSHTPKSS